MPPYRILCWNVNGVSDLFSDPTTQTLFKTYDILFFSETKALPPILTEYTPPGFNVLVSNYPSTLNQRGPTHCGIALYYRTHIQLQILLFTAQTWQPIIWVRYDELIFGFAYLPPTESNYLVHWTQESLEHLLTAAAQYQRQFPSHGIIISGDLNARRAVGPDSLWTERGNILHYNLEEDWTIHAPSPTLLTTVGTFTCVDYILLSPQARNRTPTLATLPFTEHSDHAPLSINIHPIAQAPQLHIPLAHAAPPPLSAAQLNDHDLRERRLVRGLDRQPPTAPSMYKPYRPDTTHLRRRRKEYQSLLQRHRANPTPASLEAYKTARNATKAERRRLQASQRTAENAHYTALPPTTWLEVITPHVKHTTSSLPVQADGPALEAHYTSLLNHHNDPPEPYAGDPAPPNPLFSDPFSEDEVQMALDRMKNSSTGEDKVYLHPSLSPTPKAKSNTGNYPSNQKHTHRGTYSPL